MVCLALWHGVQLHVFLLSAGLYVPCVVSQGVSDTPLDRLREQCLMATATDAAVQGVIFPPALTSLHERVLAD